MVIRKFTPNPNGTGETVIQSAHGLCYDEGKRCAETLFFDYRRQHGLNIKVARIFNTYGARMHPNDGRVVSNFIVQALNGDEITIYGDGEQTRSFCFVDDMIEGCRAAYAECRGVDRAHQSRQPGRIQNSATSQSSLSILPDRGPVSGFFAPRRTTREDGAPDISQAETELGWTPRVSLRVGLERTIDYFDGLLSEKQRS